MIECCDEFIYYKKPRKLLKFKFKKLFIILMIIALIIGYYHFFIVKQIYNVFINYTYAESANCINKAILTSMNDNYKYDDLITLEKNSSGDIVYLSANSTKINNLSRVLADTTYNNLSNSLKDGVPIPAFTFTGLGFLSGYGKSIKYKMVQVSLVTCDFENSFVSVGINQTLHSIYALITTSVKISNLTCKKSLSCETKVLICETVLLGKVPEIYLNNGKI